MRRKSKSQHEGSNYLSGAEREVQETQVSPDKPNPQKTHQLNAASEERSVKMNKRTNPPIHRIVRNSYY